MAEDVWAQAARIAGDSPAQNSIPAPKGGDVWAQAASSSSPTSPQAPVAPDPNSHGDLYSAAKRVLDFKPTEDTGNSILDAINTFGNAPMAMLQGAARGALSTAAGLGTIANKLTGSTQPFNQQNLSGLTDANGIAQGIGKTAEQVGEFFIPGAPEISGAGKLAKAGNLALDAAKSGAIAGVQTGGDPTAAAIGAATPVVAPLLVKTAGTLLNKGLGLTTGAGEKAIQRAFENPQSSDLVKAMKGDITPENIIDNVQDSVTKFRNDASAKYAKDLNAHVTNANINDWTNKAAGFMNDMDSAVDKKLADFGAVSKVDPKTGNKVLNLRHVASEDGLKEGMTSIADMVSGWGQEARDLTPAGLDTLKKNIGPYIDGGGRLGAFAKSIYDTAKDGLNTIIPKYSEITKDYAQASDVLRDIKSALSVKADGSTNPHAAISKIQYMLKQPTNFREMVLNKLPEGQQLTDQIAGLHLHDLAPRGLVGRLLAGGEGVAALMHPASIPSVAAGALASSPRIVGMGALGAGRVAQKINPEMAKRFATYGASQAAKSMDQPQ